jgi:hypothetical protein
MIGCYWPNSAIHFYPVRNAASLPEFFEIALVKAQTPASTGVFEHYCLKTPANAGV